MIRESYIDRKERLKGEGKVELPLNIDTKKYLVGNISFPDLLVISPFLVLSILSLFIIYKLGKLSTGPIIVSLAPTFFISVMQMIKHPTRKNLSFLTFRMIWRFKFKKRQKEFIYKKGELNMTSDDNDVRKKLGVKNIFSGCYETTDNRFVKILEVSSINLSLMNDKEKESIYEGYRTFLNELQMKSIQIEQIAQPVNLSQYLLFVDRKTESEKGYAKRMLTRSYKSYIENIQKSRNMVARKRYLILSQPIKMDREKALGEIERLASIVQLKIENMLMGSAKLTAKILQNDDLIKLLYTCLDYDNAQAQGNYIVSRANKKTDITLGVNSAKEVLEAFEKTLKESIH